MDFIRKLPIPKEIKAQFPLSAQTARIKEARDAEMKRIFTGESDKFILVIGPCSADREDAVLDYVTRLAKVQEAVKEKLFLIPRIYTGKPRTTGDGYKGLMHQPDPTANRTCSRVSSPCVNCTYTHWNNQALGVQMKCFIRKINVICPTCSLMWLSAHVPWKISSIVW